MSGENRSAELLEQAARLQIQLARPIEVAAHTLEVRERAQHERLGLPVDETRLDDFLGPRDRVRDRRRAVAERDRVARRGARLLSRPPCLPRVRDGTLLRRGDLFPAADGPWMNATIRHAFASS